jgi:drug/metabolite transporter (DMT)-like permease
MTSQRPLAIAAMVLVMITWGSTFVITKVSAREIPPLTLAFLRFAIATVALLPLAWSRGGMKRLPNPIPAAPLFWMALAGIAFFTIAFNYALVHASATQGALIYALGPAAIAVGAVLVLREKLSVTRTLGIILSTLGVGIVILAGQESGGDAPNPLLGAFWMVGAISAWAVYTIYAKRLAHADQVIVTTCISALGALMLLPLSAMELARVESLPMPSLRAWMGLLFLGVVASSLAYVAYNYALRVLDASLVGVFTNLDPIVGVLTAAMFLSETLQTWQIVGGAIALGGMWLASTSTASVTQPASSS